MSLRREDWLRIKRVFDGALACDPAERNAFLASACGNDQSLRREVETLLAAHRHAASFLEFPASSVLDIPLVPREVLASRVGPYRIERVLGRGSMGVVYAGRHEETGLRAAVKTVEAPKADKLLQIRREIRALARLRHPGVVRILDHGAEHGRPWYAMELLEHPTLAAWSNGRHCEEKLGLAWRLCETLAYMHGEGVLHRDLNPRNVLVTGRGLPVLVDFGLVGHVGLATGREVLDEARVAGSIAYMAPEQIGGDLPDPRTDLYALGCILYELLTGHVPFDGSVREVIEQHRHRNPRLPSELAGGIAPPLDRLVLQLLAKEPRDRIAYAADVGSALERLGAAAPPAYAQAPSPRAYLCRPPLAGRSSILDQLDARLSGAVRGSGAVVLIGGESGVGKTRLVLEAASRAIALGYRVIAGGTAAILSKGAAGTRPEGSPLQPLVPLLQAIADRCTEGGLETAERLLGQRGPVLAAYAPALSHVPGQQEHPAPEPLPAAHAQARLFRYLADALAAYAASVPAVVLLLDDLQWSDELTLGFLDYLVRGRIAAMPVVVIGAYRSEECRETLKLIAHSNAAFNITLGRISPDDVGVMIGGSLSLAEPPRGFVRFLAERSEGNPYFVTEYLRMAVSERVLVRNAQGQWIFADTADPTEDLCSSLPLPRSLRDVVDRRLRKLSPLAFRVMKCASVIGREVDIGIVQMAEALCEAEASEAIDELVSRHVLELTEVSGCRFTHDKIREIPYSELPEGERRMLHGRVAAALEQRCTDATAPAEMSASIGRHWSFAGDPVRAVPHLHKAGDEAVALHALRDAIALYREAVACLERSAVTETARRDAIAIREKLADTLSLNGMHREARAELDRALAACEPRELMVRARLQHKIGKTLMRSRDYAGALAAYAAAEDILEATADRPLSWQREWVQLQLSRAWIGYWQGRSEEMAGLIERAGPVVRRPGLALERSLFYQALAGLNLRKERYAASEETVEHARRALIAAREAGAAVDAVFTRFELGFALLLRGRLDHAERELGAALQAARRVGDVSTEVRCLAYLVATQRRARRVEGMQRLAEEALGVATAAGMTDYAAVATAGLGWAACREGRGDRARDLCRRALESWNHPAFPFPFEWMARLTLLALDLDRTPPDDLVALVEPLLDPAQMRLPGAIESALRNAVAQQRRCDASAARDALRRVCGAAMRLGFL